MDLQPCPECASEMVTAQATNHGEPYFYCRTCKKELSERVLVIKIAQTFEDTHIVDWKERIGRFSCSEPQPQTEQLETPNRPPDDEL